MSNILIIKHGSLGDIVQISGAIKDIKENFIKDDIFILTTPTFVELLAICPYVTAVLMDRRLPRWNIGYLIKLKKNIKKFNFVKVFDLQNSSRTSFYRKFLIRDIPWSSSETILDKGRKKIDFDRDSVLNRFDEQLKKSGLITKNTLKPDFTWASVNVDKIINQYFGKKFILLFPFCSPQLSHKKWSYFNELIKIIKSKHLNIEIAVAPGPNEIEETKKIESVSILNNETPLNIMELTGLILKASYVVANDTGPAHMAAHLGQRGVVLFGPHTTAKKVSIETEKFKAITVDNLNDLTAEKVYLEIKNKLELIN